MDPDRIQRALRQHLKTDRMLGVEAVPYLVEIDLQAVHNVTPVREAPPVKIKPAPGSTPAPGSAPGSPASPLQLHPSSFTLDTSVPADAAGRQALLDAFNDAEVRACTRCALCNSRTQTVFGEGDPTADVMFIGEGPGRDEDIQGRPFVGRSGELLDKQIQAMGQHAKIPGFDRRNVYIANVVKCRPPQNRTPTPEEAEACWTYLSRQIMIIQPKVIITLGGPAAKRLLNTDQGVTRLRGNWQQVELGGRTYPLMPTFHPAYLLRSYTRENRMKVWSDLQAAMDQAIRARSVSE